MLLFEIGRLRKLVDISLVSTIYHRGADLRHLNLCLMQVALAKRVCLIVCQRCTVVLNVVSSRQLRRLLHQMLLKLQRGPPTIHLMRAVVHGARSFGRAVP